MAIRPLKEFVAILADIPWFASAGTVAYGSACQVEDWSEASKYICDQLVWLNFKNAISNRYRRLWLQAYPKGENKAVFEAVEKHVKEICRRKPVKSIDEHLTAKQKNSRPSASFVYHVKWDLNFIGFEFVCQDDLDPLFFVPMLLPVYQRGNFPCGWRGTMINQAWSGNGPDDLPRGRLRVL